MKKGYLSARLSNKDLENLGYLAEVWGLKNSSAIIRKSLEFVVTILHQEEKQPDKLAIIEKSAFIGSVRLTEDLSSTYKQHIRDKVRRKHGIHHS